MAFAPFARLAHLFLFTRQTLKHAFDWPHFLNPTSTPLPDAFRRVAAAMMKYGCFNLTMLLIFLGEGVMAVLVRVLLEVYPL